MLCAVGKTLPHNTELVMGEGSLIVSNIKLNTTRTTKIVRLLISIKSYRLWKDPRFYFTMNYPMEGP